MVLGCGCVKVSGRHTQNTNRTRGISLMAAPKEILEASGTFWLATSPKDANGGRLVVAGNGSAKVALTPALYPGFELETVTVDPDGTTMSQPVFTPDRGPQTLHGWVDSGEGKELPVSLLQAHATNWSGETQTFQPLWTLVGAHVTNDSAFNGIRVRLPGIASNPDSASLGNGGTVRTADGWIEITKLPNSTYSELGRTVVRPLCTLLTLASGTPVRPFALQVSAGASGWWPVHARSGHVEGALGQPPIRPLVEPSDLNLTVVATWLDRATSLGPLPGAFASVLEVHLSVEAQALILTTVSEGLHRVLFPDTRRFSVEHAEIVRNAAVEAVRRVDDNKSTADAVSGFLSHVYEVSYAKRLQELARRAEKLVPGVTGNTGRWKTLVYDTRNKYAHQTSADWMEEEDLDRVLTTAQSLRWVLRLLLLDQAGLSSELLRRRFRSNQPYQFFLTNAAQWCPTVYA